MRTVFGDGELGSTILSLMLCELHWQPVHQRVRFKLVMYVYKCLKGLAPVHLTNDCKWTAESTCLLQKLVVQRKEQYLYFEPLKMLWSLSHSLWRSIDFFILVSCSPQSDTSLCCETRDTRLLHHKVMDCHPILRCLHQWYSLCLPMNEWLG